MRTAAGCFRFAAWNWIFVLVAVIPCLGGQENAPLPPPAQDDSTGRIQALHPSTDSISAGGQIYEYIAYPTLQALIWPVDKLFVPVVKALTYPSQQPLRYFLNENVIDHVRSLVSFGEGGKFLVYPTLNVAPGTGSRTGATVRDNALFGSDKEKLASYLLYYVNGDLKAHAYVTADRVLGTPFTAKISANIARMKNNLLNQPGTDSFYDYSDSSEQYQFQLQYPVFLGFQIHGDFSLRYNRLDSSATNYLGPNLPAGDFFKRNDTGGFDPAYRGIGQSFLDRSWSIGVGRDTRNNENITLAGSWLNADWRYHDIGLGHSYQEWGGQYTTYLKLGRERYEITDAEERQRGGLSMDQFLQQLDYEKIRQGLFSRKVVVLHFYAAQSFEIPGNSMPLYGLQTLGNDTPLRGYAGARFRDYTVAALSTEYRFPMLRLMDGTLFDEYGVSGRDWGKIDYLNYKNSWGFGIRVRQPDLFLFRMELGIHGFSGAELNISVDEPF